MIVQGITNTVTFSFFQQDNIFIAYSTFLFSFAEVPEVPDGLKVLDKSGRAVQLSWVAPYDGRSPIKRYLIEFKIAKGSCNFKFCILQYFHSIYSFYFNKKNMTNTVSYFTKELGRQTLTEFLYLVSKLLPECSTFDLPPRITCE